MEYSKPAILYYFISAGNEMVEKSFNRLWSVTLIDVPETFSMVLSTSFQPDAYFYHTYYSM